MQGNLLRDKNLSIDSDDVTCELVWARGRALRESCHTIEDPVWLAKVLGNCYFGPHESSSVQKQELLSDRLAQHLTL